MKDIIFIKTNKSWKANPHPLVSVITSVFNRREIILRAIRSVDNQTFKDIEYIVVNNGSTIDIDDVIEGFMEEASIPIMYIKRSNGIGPHTGRNSAIREARGEYLSMIDSDDEYFPNAMQVLVDAWMSIPENKRNEYREVVAQCADERGNRLGEPFPDGINNLSRKETRNICLKPEYQCEHANMSRTTLLKENPFAEPEGINYVSELAVWYKLDKYYKSYYLNDIVKRYYVGSEDSITNNDILKMSKQSCCNIMWDNLYLLNHWADNELSFVNRLRRITRYCEMKIVLRKTGIYPKYYWMTTPLKGFLNNVLSIFLWVPSLVKANKIINNN